MNSLKSEHIFLRALEPEDLNFLYQIENNVSFWQVSHTQLPYSKYILSEYLKNAGQDIYEAKQFRFVICNHKNEQVGLIDFFDFDPKNLRVGIGIVVDEMRQNNKYGSEALSIAINYAFHTLNLHQVYANIEATNIKSIALFEKIGFIKIGVKKDWNFNNGNFTDEINYQYLKK
ncbi:MAG: GNAT family N-acetyltransferase [Lutibacter sp.]